VKQNVRKALTILKTWEMRSKEREHVMTDLHKGMTLIDNGGETNVQRGKNLILKLLDRHTGEIHSKDVLGEVVFRKAKQKPLAKVRVKPPVGKMGRQRMGTVEKLELTKDRYKAMALEKEEYLVNSALEREERNRKAQKEKEGENEEKK